jgi:hypothetical protein
VRSSRQRPPQPEARGETLTPSTYAWRILIPANAVKNGHKGRAEL